MSELVKTILQNKQQINSIHVEKEALIKIREKEIIDLKYNIYGPQISALEHELNDKIKAIEQKEKAEIEEKNKLIMELNKPGLQAKRILAFLKLDKKPVDQILKEKVTLRHGNTLEDMGLLVNDDYLKISLFIVHNDKPVNCYSLIAMGYCKFYAYRLYDEFFTLNMQEGPTQWQNAAYISGDSPRLDLTIKSGPSVEFLKAWLQKNKDKILQTFIKEYYSIKAEFIEALKFKIEDFKPLMQLYCNTCGFYISIFDNYGTYYIEHAVKCDKCGSQDLSRFIHLGE